MQHLAYHDPLTDLPNRLLFHDRLQQALLRAKRRMSKVALLFLDVDRFKFVNDSLGHDVGDRFLCELARRLRASVRGDDTVARIAGDEFTVVLENIDGVRQASEVAAKILENLRVPMAIENHELIATASIGFALFPDHGDSAGELLRFADSAMFASKQAGRNRATAFEPHHANMAGNTLQIENGLRSALERGELELHYQPQFHAGDGELSGFEALLRWNHPQRGLVLPGEFIRVAEDSGLIDGLGDRVLIMACRQLSAWVRDGFRHRLAVNVATRQLSQPDFAQRLGQILAEAGAPPTSLELEITEGALAGDTRAVGRVLGEIRETGVTIAIDDFGTGYSSLGRLRSLPISRVKIDGSFVRGLPHNAEDRALAAAIITMAHNLNLEVVAEGVETAAQQRFLESSGSDFLQGFHLGRPLPVQRLVVS